MQSSRASDYFYSDEKSTYTLYDGTSYNEKVKDNAVSLFSEADLYITNDLAAKVGTRLEHSALLNKWNVAPRLSIAYKFSKHPLAPQCRHAPVGKQFRLRGKGMPVLRSRDIGDLYIQAQVETPQSLTRRQKELLAEFEKESSGATQPEAAGFFTKVKDFFAGQ